MSLGRDLRTLSRRRGFLKLLGVRLTSQVGDGMFQAGLAALFFFRPESMTNAAAVASALVVMFLPYSLVGPLTGPFLDRWPRRQILAVGNGARFALALAVAAAMRTLGVGPVVYVLALVCLGLARFMLAGLSAGLPKVVGRPEHLVLANSIVPTLGGIATGIGAIIGVALRLFLPDGASRELASLVTAALAFLGASLAARTLARDELGPDASEVVGSQSLRGAVAQLRQAVAYLARRGTPAFALSAMALHRFAYYLQFIALILAARNLLADPSDADAGIAFFGTLGGAMVVGHFVAVVLTPIAYQRVRPSQWIVMCLVGGSAGQVAIAASLGVAGGSTPAVPVLLAGLFVFGVGVQGAKIAVDAIVQADTADEFRGRAFSIYDVMFNLAACLASAVALVVLPDVGLSPSVQVALVAFVWLVALAYYVAVRSVGDAPRDVDA
ncbi:MAG: MFS transporter [Actinomycetaceae bacterium]|nr:MFS transporter [Actinomycetaceae bacterium]